MTKKAHKKYLEDLNKNPDWCTFGKECPIINKTAVYCKECWFHESEAKRRKELRECRD